MENVDLNPMDFNRFEEELNLINDSITDIDSLYEEVKDHFDAVKNSYSRNSLSFIEKQTSNLVSLRTAKISMIKERINLKKIQADIHYKNERSKTEDGGGNDRLVRDVARYLMENDMAVNQIEDSYAGIVGEDIVYNQSEKLNDTVDDRLEQRIKELEEQGEITFTDNEVSISYEKQSIAIVVLKKGKAWKFGAIDNNGNIIKNYPVPDKADYKITLQYDEDEQLIAVDQNEKIYKVIKVG